MPMHVKVGGTWKEITNPGVKVGDSWKSITGGWVNVGGVWKQFYTAAAQIAYNDASADATQDITAPSGISEGDILIHIGMGVRFGSYPTGGAPSGFTLVHTEDKSYSTARMRLCISYKIADGTESSTSITSGVTSASYYRSGIAHFQVTSGEVSSVSFTETGAENASGNPAAQTVEAGDATGGPTIGIAFSIQQGSEPTSLSITGGEGPFTSGQGGAGYGMGFDIVGQNLANSDLTADMDDHGNQTFNSGYFELT